MENMPRPPCFISFLYCLKITKKTLGKKQGKPNEFTNFFKTSFWTNIIDPWPEQQLPFPASTTITMPGEAFQTLSRR